MFEKIIILLNVLLLTACGNRAVTCKLEKQDKSISLDIKAHYDDIESIKVRTVFELPNDLLADEDWLLDLNNQLDDSYHYEDNLLVSEYDIELDDIYSLDKTIDYLRKDKYYCE